MPAVPGSQRTTAYPADAATWTSSVAATSPAAGHVSSDRVGAGTVGHRHPAVHLGAVGGDRGVPGRPVQPSGGAEPAAEAGEQPPPSGCDGHQLPRRAVVRDRGDDDPAAGGDPADGERPVDERLGRPPVQGHPQQLDRSGPRDPEQRRAVGEHGRGRPVGAGGLPRVQQWLEDPAGDGHAAQGRTAAEIDPVGAQVGVGGDAEHGAGGVEDRQPAPAAAAGDPPRPPAGRRDQVDVADEVAAGAGVAGGDEGQRAAVGRPGDVGVLAGAVGQLPRPGQGDAVVGGFLGQVEDEQAAGPVAGPAVVRPRGEAGEQPGGVGVGAVRGHAGGEGQPSGVR
jgi:hypothetical protein